MKIQTKLGKLKYFFALGACSAVLTTSLSIPASAQHRNTGANNSCGSNAGVWVCNRGTDFGVGNHSYIWDARNRQACGMQSSSSSSETNTSEAGPSKDSCNFVQSSEGKEDDIVNHCRENANNGVWVLGVNDCHNAVKDSVEQSGLKYPGAPGGRFGELDYSRDSKGDGISNSDSTTSVENEYSRDSDGDGILDQSYDPSMF